MKVLIIGTNMMNLYHHRLELIQALLRENYKVVIAAPRGGEEKALEKIGCKFIHTPVDNRGTNIKNDLKLINDLIKICRSEKPDIILTFYTKTNIYGGLVARMLGIPYIENICGLGTALGQNSGKSKLMAFLYKQALKKTEHLFFQNKSNIEFFQERKLYNGEYSLLPGSGVSLSRYTPQPYPASGKIEFLFASRIIKDKGIDEFLKVAQSLKKKYPETYFHVVGPSETPYTEILNKEHESGTIIYHGKLENLQPVILQTHCTVLPSYYPEGMANILLESASSCRPVITTSLPGCAETVDDGVSGFMVKEKDAEDLENKMETFILLPYEEKVEMGKKGREKMEKEFDRNVVVRKYLENIAKILNK